MIEKTAPTFNVDIHMAGDMRFAAQMIQRLAMVKGLCVTLTAQTFVYTGGREEGFKIGLINYPRFPSSLDELVAKAKWLADCLVIDLGQHSYSIVTPVETIWRSRRTEEAKAEGELHSPSDRSAPSIGSTTRIDRTSDGAREPNNETINLG
ncbi:hypothetical protein G6M50_06380 [Agrobacterium rhizogenes]|nr:hypothetical protein [Rhizobium rhizogenes]NTJ77430.1 hypothetical protein [Rhizobium rhizogenes]